MKIAILFHGHLRSFRKTSKYFRKNILNTLKNSGHNVDIFMHTWSDEEFTTQTWHKGAKIIKKTNVEDIKNHYNPENFLIEKQEKIDETNKIFKIPYESIKYIWYSFHKSWLLMEKSENEKKIKYDVVLVTRPDIQNYSPIFIDEIESTSFLWQCQVFTKRSASDVILFGGRKQVNILNYFYHYFDKLYSRENVKKVSHNEYIFNNFITLNANVRKSQYCMPRDWRPLRSWWDENHIENHRKWDKDLAIKDIKSDDKYLFFRRDND